MKLFLSPHNDDETLFGAFTIIRERPHVLVVYDGMKQQASFAEITAKQRRQETISALTELLQPGVCSYGFAKIPDHYDNALAVEQMLRESRGYMKWEHVYAPAIEEGGHEQHNLVGRKADELWPGNVTHYLTYRRGLGKSVSRRIVDCEPEWILRKLKALACYESQILTKEANCWQWFREDLLEYYAE